MSERKHPLIKRIIDDAFIIIFLPFIPLIALILVPIPLYIAVRFDYREYMPTIIVLAGFVVMAFGSFSKFNSEEYIADLKLNRQPVNDKAIINISKVQLILTLIYIGIGVIYIVSAFLIFFFFP